MQVWLIGVARLGGDEGGGQAVAHHPHRAPEAQDAAQRRRPVPVDGEALPLQCPVRPADLVGRSERPEDEPDAIFEGWVGGW